MIKWWALFFVLISNLTMAQESVVLLLVDPKDPDLAKLSETNSIPSPDEIDRYLENWIKENNNPEVTAKYKRLHQEALQENKFFLSKVTQFLKTKFDIADPLGVPEFKESVIDISDSIFIYSSSEKLYFQKLYLLNRFFLEYPSEAPRFATLDRYLQDEHQKRVESGQKWRSRWIKFGMVLGAAAGGFLGYQAATKIIPIPADQKWAWLIAKWAGRVGVVVISSTVGGMAGSYLSFLASDHLVGSSRDYIDPIDPKREDLRDILDTIELLE